MKNKQGNFSQLSNKAIYELNKHNFKVPYSTRWLYVHLNFLENKFTNNDPNGFYFHTLTELAMETGIDKRVIIRGIRQLKDLGLIETWQGHWRYKDGKKSEKHMTAFRLLEAE